GGGRPRGALRWRPGRVRGVAAQPRRRQGRGAQGRQPGPRARPDRHAQAAQGQPAQAREGRGAGRGAGRTAGGARGRAGRPRSLHRWRKPRRGTGETAGGTAYRARGGRGGPAGAVRGRVASGQARREDSTVVTTRTRFTCGLLWSRPLLVATPWLALRIPPRREPESWANCWAESRAAAVASAIRPGLMSLSLV